VSPRRKPVARARPTRAAIEWHTEQRPLSSLVEWERNPRQLTERQAADLAESLRRFGYVEPIAVNLDGTVLGGHMRRRVLLAQSIVEPGALVDVRVPSRQLEPGEVEELNVRLNRNAGDWDYDKLADFYEWTDLETWGFEGLAETRSVALRDLKPHPRNYRKHPADQIAHLVASITRHGFFRNIVVARDGTILVGHGVVEAAQSMGLERVPAVRIAVGPEDPRALRIMESENEIRNLAEVDDRALTELLKELMGDGGLEGTGFDGNQLAALALTTRPAGELRDKDAAAAWAGLPEYEPAGQVQRLVVQFDNEGDRARFMEQIGATVVSKKNGAVWSIWWPEREREDLVSLRFRSGAEPAPVATDGEGE